MFCLLLINSLSWNFNFHRYLFDSVIEELTRFPSSLGHVYLLPSFTNERICSLTSSRLFNISSFYKALSITLSSPIFTFLLNPMLRLLFGLWLIRRLIPMTHFNWGGFIKLSSWIIVLYVWRVVKRSIISFLLALWQRLLHLANLDWIPLRGIAEMMGISFWALQAFQNGRFCDKWSYYP